MNDKLVAMLTNRDIVVRAVADARDLEETKVQDIMTADGVLLRGSACGTCRQAHARKAN
jgi:CBS domain-containing protein